MEGDLTDNLKLETAQRENAERAVKVIDSILVFGIKRDDIQTQVYQVLPQYEHINGERVFKGYRVNHDLRVNIKDMSAVGIIINEAVRAGANSVSDIIFSVSNPKKYYEAVMNSALNNAIEKAAVVGLDTPMMYRWSSHEGFISNQKLAISMGM